jgi:hypothetical protein
VRRATRVWAAALAAALLLASAGPAGASAAPAAGASATPPVRHVFLILLENKAFSQTFTFTSPAPYLAWTLPGMGALIPQYYGVAHESNPNYIALISGQGANPQSQADCQLYDDFTPGAPGPDGQALGTGCVFPGSVPTIADQLTGKGLTWKGYMEDMGNATGQPQTCRHPALNSQDTTQTARPGDQYAARHNPFVYFHSIIDTPACARDDVPLDRLSADLRSPASTPNYSFITPNLCDDGHDAPCVDGKPGGLVSADLFLKTWVPRILASPAYREDGLLIITFDENDSSDAASCCGEPQFPNTPNNGGPVRGMGGGQVGAVALSPYIDPGTVDTQPYNHFSLLASVEDLFGLGRLGYAGQAGLATFGSDLFTCYRAAGPPRPRRGRLPAGSLIKLVQLGEDTSGRRSVLVKLWYAGRVSLQARRRRHLRTFSRRRSGSPCQPLTLRLPPGHGQLTLSARAFGGTERRTISY